MIQRDIIGIFFLLVNDSISVTSFSQEQRIPNANSTGIIFIYILVTFLKSIYLVLDPNGRDLSTFDGW